MATADRKPGTRIDPAALNLLQLLKDAPYNVGFFQAVQLLERIYPDREPVGFFVPPSRELVRFSAYPRLSFPASEIQEILWPPDEAPPVMAVNFFGLTGPSGVMPHLYTLTLIERRFAKDRRLEELLDIFHHRLISLYYRAWRKYRVSASFHSSEHRVTGYLRDIVGIGTAGLMDRQEVADRSLLFFAGILALQPHSAIAFEHFLREYFGAPVEVQQFVGAWYDLPRDAQCELMDEDKASRQLGLGAVAGDQIFDHSSKARIRIGPLTLRRYRDFLPGNAAHAALRALARFWSGGQIDFDMQLVLDRDEVPECELGAGGERELPLGLCSWAKTGDFEHDPDDAIVPLGEESWA
jgi:type VI secretion system protein ImpH